MKKFFSISRNQATLILTLAVVVLLGAFYLFVYIPRNERELKQRNFRTLQQIDENIHKKIDNSTNLLDGILKVYVDSPDNTKNAINNYIDNFPDNNFKLFKPRDSIKGARNFKKAKVPANASIIGKEEGEARQILKVDNDLEQFNLKVYRTGKNNDTSSIALRYKFDQFIKPLLPKNVFDQYIIFSKNRVVYETFPSGLSYSKKDSLLNMRNGVAAAAIRNQQISGVDYRMFLQPVGFDSSNEWIIAGLITEGRYQLEKNKVPSGTVLLLITIALAIMLAFPWIKVYLMGCNDRLTFKDYISCLLVSMLIIGITFFVLFRYNGAFRNDDTPNAKENLASSITTAFNAEINDAYKQLNAYDTLFASDKNFRNDIQYLNDTLKLSVGDLYKGNAKPNPIVTAKIKNVKECCGAIDVNQVYWMNDKGDELYNWDKRSMNGPHGNFKSRNYFSNVTGNNTFSLNGGLSGKFYLEPVMSWSTGTFRTVISKRSAFADSSENKNSVAVAALSLNVKSLDNVVMPGGYGFAIIDNAGKVLYHSDKYRNLNENLLEEFSKNDELKSCLVAHSKRAFRTEYGGEKCAVLVQPMHNLPYFIIVYSNLDYLNTREIETFSFTVSMMTVFFLFLVAELGIVLFASSRRSMLKKQFFITTWLWPRVSSNEQYHIASLFNLAMIMLLVIFFSISDFAEYLFILMIAVTMITIFLNLLFAKRYKEEGKTEYKNYKRKTAGWLLAVAIFICLFAFKNLNEVLGPFLYFIICAVVLLCVFYYAGNYMALGVSGISSFIQKLLLNKYSKWGYIQSYTFMALTRLIITSAIPIVFFYSTGYNYEQALTARHKQIEFANHLLEKYTELDSAKLAKITTSNTAYKYALYKDDAWIHEFTMLGDSETKTKTKDTAAANALNKEDIFSNFFLNLFRFYKSDLAVTEKNLYNSSADSAILFHFSSTKHCSNGNSNMLLKTKSGNGFLSVSSGCILYRFPALFKWPGFLFWMGLLLLLALFFALLYFIIKKIFAIDLPDPELWNDLDEKFLANTSLKDRLMVLGAPGSNALPYVLEQIKKIKHGETQLFVHNEDSPDTNTVYIADLSQIPTADNANEWTWKKIKLHINSSRYNCIILNNFEFGLKDLVANENKLGLLQQLTPGIKRKIIIISSVHPVIFLTAISEMRKQNNPDKDSVNYHFEKWNMLMGRYCIYIKPLVSHHGILHESEIEAAITRETEANYCYSNMQQSISEHIKPEKTDDNFYLDALIIKTQIAAQNYYTRIWQSLLKEEKFIVYDLAEDSLVNSRNILFLNLLISKGIIVRKDGMLQLFSHGFRNYILTAIGETEFSRIQKQIRDDGGWQRLKTPLWITILTILTFLLASQQEMYSKVIGYIGALAAGIPAITKIFSLFEQSGNKSR